MFSNRLWLRHLLIGIVQNPLVIRSLLLIPEVVEFLFFLFLCYVGDTITKTTGFNSKIGLVKFGVVLAHFHAFNLLVMHLGPLIPGGGFCGGAGSVFEF